jgi:uncharacterized protein
VDVRCYDEGEQEALPPFLKELQKSMKLSKYTKLYLSEEDKNSLILFSTKKASAVLVPSALIKDIENNSLSEEEQETLFGLGLLARSDEEEKQEMLNFIRELNVLNRTFIATVVLNLDCNLGCRYCFEGTRKGKLYLSDETADKFVDFVKRRDLSNKNEIKITFYGGEPLLSAERIVSISEKILSFAGRKGLKYGFSLVTNGTLLTPGVVKKLAPLGLKNAKVTLDGPEYIHNNFRPFKSSAGSFDVIVRNIKDACDKIHVVIGGNYTKDNYREFPRLLDHLLTAGLSPDKIPMVRFDPVVNENGAFALPDFNDGCSSSREPWLIDASLYLREEILKRGYRTQKITPAPCIVELFDSIMMDYDGALYKCPVLIGRKDYRAGDITTGLTDYRASHALDNWKNEECLACAYLPLCFGGCRYMKLLQDGDINGINCRKEYFDSILAQLVSQDIKYDL